MKKILKLICFIPLFILLFGCDASDIEIDGTETLVEAEVVVKLTGATYTTYPDQQAWLEGVGVHERGSMITLTINIPEDSPYVFGGWYLTNEDFWKGRAASLETSYTFKAEYDLYTGIFARIDKNTIELEKGVVGRGNTEGLWVEEFVLDKPNKLSAIPYLGSYFDGWYVDGKLLSNDEEFDFIPTSDMKRIEARFADDPKMENFYFQSDENRCSITSVINKEIDEVNIPRYVTEIGMYAFSDCYNISFIELPRNVERIGVNAFYNCTNLTSIVLPKKVSFIGYNAFGNTNSLEKIYYNGKISDFEQIEFENNYDLDDNLIYYYSTTEPTSAGNYWHYVNDVPTIWENE